MRIRQFLSVVPKAVQQCALVIAVAGVLIGLVAGRFIAAPHLASSGELWRTTLECGAAGLGLGLFVSIWLLCLGFVYKDAQRRLMRPVLWVMVAFLVPHLLGFLLYFVLRQPLGSPCRHCGQIFPENQRFCSWCGTPREASPTGNVQPVVG